MKGWFGLTNQDQSVMELSRLCMIPDLNGTNATSYLLGNSLKLLKKTKELKAVITLADNSRHVASIYQVCNFKYYGLTDKKTDFYTVDGKKNPRGSTKDIQGVWLERTRKHRYAFTLDNSLKVKYKQCTYPKLNSNETDECKSCHNEVVYDDRFNVNYKCPICYGYDKGLEII